MMPHQCAELQRQLDEMCSGVGGVQGAIIKALNARYAALLSRHERALALLRECADRCRRPTMWNSPNMADYIETFLKGEAGNE